MALVPRDINPISVEGWNKAHAATVLSDHTVRAAARPNSDTFYQFVTLDLRDDAVIVEYPAINSDYVSLLTVGYDHYVDMPLSTLRGDFAKSTRVLFYSDRTKDFDPSLVENIDNAQKMTTDFALALIRAMPHQSDTERMEGITEALHGVEVKTLSEWQGLPKRPVTEVDFPAFGTDPLVFGSSFAEAMQFIFNHTSFDSNDELDQGVLSALKPYCIEPQQEPVADCEHQIDNERLAATAAAFREDALVQWNNPNGFAYPQEIFLPKGEGNKLRSMAVVSAIGPIGMPFTEATYPGISAAGGASLNSDNHYVIGLSADQLKAANAFWSITIYDGENGWLIPNEFKKYSVGPNAGMRLSADGGIDIHVSPKRPAGVPVENWLPSGEVKQDLDVVMRIYGTNVEVMETWEAPVAELAD